MKFSEADLTFRCLLCRSVL